MRAGVLSACMLSTAVGICTLVKPDKTLERQVRFLLSLLLIISLAVPLLQMELPDDLFSGTQIEMQQAENQAVFDDALLQETQRRTEDALRERLAAEGIQCDMLSVTLHRDAEGCIYCSEVRAACNDLSGAAAVLRDALGEEVSICAAETLPES